MNSPVTWNDLEEMAKFYDLNLEDVAQKHTLSEIRKSALFLIEKDLPLLRKQDAERIWRWGLRQYGTLQFAIIGIHDLCFNLLRPIFSRDNRRYT